MERFGIPVFDGEERSGGEGYEIWSRKMKMLFKILDLWDVVNQGYKEGSTETGSEENKMKDLKALYLIQRGVSSYIFPFIAEAKISKEAWEAIKNVVDDYYYDDDDDDDDEDDNDNDNDNDNEDDSGQNIIEDLKDNLKEDYVTSDPLRNNLKKDHHVTDPSLDSVKRDQVILSIERKLTNFNSVTKEKRCIFKVPDQLRRGNEEFYEPKVVAIGPNHRDKPQLAFMENHKLSYLKRLLERTAKESVGSTVQDARPEVPQVSVGSLVQAASPEVPQVSVGSLVQDARPEVPQVSVGVQAASPEVPQVSVGSLVQDARPEVPQVRVGSTVQDARPEVPQVSVRSLVQAIWPMVRRVRKCYGDSTLLDDKLDKFVQMLVLDGCFIIELLIEFKNKPTLFQRMSQKTNDNYFIRYLVRQTVIILNKWTNTVDRGHNTWIDSVDILYITAFQNDLVLIDNQIPFFIIKTLYSVINPTHDSTDQLENLTSKFFQLKYGMTTQPKIRTDESNEDNCHLLYIAHKTLCSKREETVKNLPMDGETFCLKYSATMLEETDVNLIAKSESESIFDIIFSNGKMEIPCFVIDDQFEIEIRNFIALEMCQLEGNRYYCDYVVFMDHLIASSHDVDLLISRGIITNYMIDADFVNEMFMKLTKKVVRSYPYTYSDISKRLNEYCERGRNTFWVSFKHKYLKNPLTFIAILVASMVFLLTVTQTVFTIIK